MIKRNNGITLIALVITIVVLLILAGVSIAMLTGSNGILTQAIKAKKLTEKAQWEEQIKQIILSWKMLEEKSEAKDYLEKELKKIDENTIIDEYDEVYIIKCGENKAILDKELEMHEIVEGNTEEWIWTVNQDGTATLTDNRKKTEIQNLVIPNMIDGIYVKELSGVVFKECENIRSLEIAYGVNKIGAEEFSGCTNISGDVYLPSSITSLGIESFYNCSSIKNLNLDCKANIQVSNNPTHGTFGKCTSLENVNISSNISAIGDYSFYDSNLNGTMTIECSGEIASNAFRNMKGNGTIEIVGQNITSVGEYAFYDNTLVKKVTLSDKCKKIGKSAFYECTNLEDIYLDCEADIDVTSFYYCTNLKNVYISNKVKNINMQAFLKCNIANKLEIHNTGEIAADAFRDINGNGRMEIDLKNVTSIGSYAFMGTKLTGEISIPNNVERLGVAVFEGASNISKVYINCTTIPDRATDGGQGFFRLCTNLKEVYIGTNTTTIGSDAFNGNAITDVYYSGTPEEWDKLKIGVNNQDLLNANIHYNYSK